MSDCIFCKIIKGDIPSYTVYEDDNFKAIMDISPATRGHIIIIPKKHAANIFELDEDLASKIFVVAKKIATVVSEELECDGVNILQNNGEVAGQTVFHLHVHVIPRYKDDKVKIKWEEDDSKETITKEEIEEIAKDLAKKIK